MVMRSARPSASSSGGSAWTSTSMWPACRPAEASVVCTRPAAMGGPANQTPTVARTTARTSTLRQPRTVLAVPVAGSIEGRCCLGALIPRDGAVGADDGLLVALAGEQHDIAGSRALDRRVDRRPTVGDQQEIVVAALAGCLGAHGDRFDDPVAILAARILVGHNDDPGPFPGDAAHQRALGRISLTRRAKDCDQPPAARGGDRSQQV